jgi:uncharacterized protein (TIGR03437 family)
VPTGATTGNVVVTVGETASNGVPFAVTPYINGISLPQGPIQMGFVITGTSFGNSQGTSTVTLGGVPLTVVSWSAPNSAPCVSGQSCITVQVPSGSPTGNVNVIVTVGGQQSNPFPFTVTSPFCSAAGCPF